MAGKGTHGMLFRELPPEHLAGLRTRVGLKEWDEDEHAENDKEKTKESDEKLKDKDEPQSDSQDEEKTKEQNEEIFTQVEVVAAPEVEAVTAANEDDDADATKSS